MVCVQPLSKVLTFIENMKMDNARIFSPILSVLEKRVPLYVLYIRW